MPYLKHLSDEEVSSFVKKLYKKVEAGLGKVPMLYRAMANSEDVFEAFLHFNGALGNVEIGPKLVKAVILRTSQLNDCQYCLRAHTQMAKDANLMTDEEIINCRKGLGWDEKSKTALEFVTKVVTNKGFVSQEDIDRMHQMGFSDKNIVEILGAIVVATTTNYLAHIADTPPDYPEVPPID